MVWSPVFAGQEAARIRAIVEAIARDTADGPFAPERNVPAELATVWQFGLEGLAGQSLFHGYLALDRQADPDAALALLDRATDAAGALAMPPSLYFGFAGIGWVSAHFSGRLYDETQDNHREVDRALHTAVDAYRESYELLDGLVGIGVYGLERAPALAAAVVDRLAELAEPSPDGAAFFTPAALLDAAYRSDAQHGLYNLGMAQGAAGVIGFLGAACAAGLAARPLLDDAIHWLLEREVDGHFPNTYVPGQRRADSRLGWCHGDLAVATAVHVAARAAGEPRWDDHALRIARAAAARPLHAPDAGLCHGAAGIGHLFNRFYQDTGDPGFRDAARRWLSAAVAMHVPDLGVGGYRMSQHGARYDSPGFRVGASGIGLALLAAVSHVPPAWDRLLLAS